MSWKVGWGEQLDAEEAIASVCHRRLDPLSLVHFQEVLTGRWQDKYPRAPTGWLPQIQTEKVEPQPHGGSGRYGGQFSGRQGGELNGRHGQVSGRHGQSSSRHGQLSGKHGPPSERASPRQSKGRLREATLVGTPAASSGSRPASKPKSPSTSLLPSLTDEPRALGHATEVRSLLRSRQSSRKSSRGSHPFDPF